MAYKQRSPQDVVEGGTGVGSNTAYTVLTGGITSTGAIQSIAGVGTSGQVLTSNGAAALPTFQATIGDVTGPGSSTDNALARWDGTGGDTLQDSTVLVTDNGEMTNASQPAFVAYNSVTDTNVTGDGTAYVPIFDTEVVDQNSDYNNATGVFTAPVTGYYSFVVLIYLDDLTSSHTTMDFNLIVNTSSYNITGNHVDPYAYRAAGDSLQVSLAGQAYLTASDTVNCKFTVFNGTKVVDLLGTSSTDQTYFSGTLNC